MLPNSGPIGDYIKYAKGFQQQPLIMPAMVKPLDVIRKDIGRLTKVKDVQVYLVLRKNVSDLIAKMLSKSFSHNTSGKEG